MAKPNKHAPLGQGGRFAAVVQDLMRKPGMSKGKAGAIAASAGRKKYGAKKMGALSAKGKADAVEPGQKS